MMSSWRQYITGNYANLWHYLTGHHITFASALELIIFQGLLPIHCCAMQGRVDVMKLMMKHDENDTIATSLNKEDGKKPPSLLHLAIANDFIDCAEW